MGAKQEKGPTRPDPSRLTLHVAVLLNRQTQTTEEQSAEVRTVRTTNPSKAKAGTMRRQYDDEEDGDTILADDLSICNEDERSGVSTFATVAIDSSS